MDPRPVDLAIEARHVAPVVPAGVLEHHSVIVDGGAIVAVLPTAEARRQYRPRQTVSLPEHLLIPGLVNTHTHAAMTLMRGLADDLPLMEWLGGHIWPTEAKHVGPEFVRDGTRLAVAESIRGGVTCFQDMYFFPEQVAEVCREAGFRATVSGIVIEFPTAYASGAAEYLDKAEALIASEHDRGLIRVSLAPHAPYTVSDDSFGRVLGLVRRYGLTLHCHIHETRAEVEESVARSGLRPLARLDRLGVLGPWLNAVHMTELSPAERARVAEAGVHVLHCPESNLKLASGFCPVGQLLGLGANVALGTDGCASNNDLDLLGELKTAALLAKAVAGDAATLPAARALEMATLGGAKALHRAHEIGSIEPGKRADLVAVRMDDLDALPLYDPVSQLVYAGHRRQVEEVWIDGVRKLRAGQLVGIDTAALKSTARRWQSAIRPS